VACTREQEDTFHSCVDGSIATLHTSHRDVSSHMTFFESYSLRSGPAGIYNDSLVGAVNLAHSMCILIIL
jgi:hypothetical protein